ncbi:unnamed protein product [Sphagnum jensenii]|uniref:SMODS and SLOG-associating 2TM effector domain-containing protein n=1 Tax=Sphagnum jensenii TaxID=128206 RepID=A0ABP0W2T8_9BRYO
MDQDQIEMTTVNNTNSTEVEEPAGAPVGAAFKAHEGSESDSGSQSQAQSPVEGFELAYSGKLDSDTSDMQSETRIRILTTLKGFEPIPNNFWQVAFEDYTERRQRLQNRFYKREEEMRGVKNEIYQVVGFFSAFQGLLITAAAQSNLLHCNNVGFILALSAFATAVAVIGIWQKITAMEGLRSANIEDKHCIEKVSHNLHLLQRQGIHYNFDHTHLKTPPIWHETPPIWHPPMEWKAILVSYETWLVVSVIAFGGLCIVAMRQILCNPGHSLPTN